MFTLERVTEDNLAVIKEIFHSNPAYNEWGNKGSLCTDEELRNRFFHPIPERDLYFIKADDTYVGLLDYMEGSKRDGDVRLNLLMIHGDYQGYGYGTNAYFLIENMFREKGITGLEIAIPKQNKKAKQFWEGLGFVLLGEQQTANGETIDYFEKQLL